MPAPEDSTLTASFDLLFNGLEITTGGQRIHNPAASAFPRDRTRLTP